MELLQNLIETVGLDRSFFFQLALIPVLYLILKKLLFKPYLDECIKRETLTKGRLEEGQDLTQEIEDKKNLYKEKAKKLDEEFSSLFNKSKEEITLDFAKKLEVLEQEQKKNIKLEREKIKKDQDQLNQALKQELPQMSSLLEKKILGEI